MVLRKVEKYCANAFTQDTRHVPVRSGFHEILYTNPNPNPNHSDEIGTSKIRSPSESDQ